MPALVPAYPEIVIVRIVLIELRPQYRGDINTIVEHTETVLSTIDDVRSLTVTTAADARTRREWDVCLVLHFDDLEATERYRVDPTHRAYADIYLKPLRKRIHVLHFEPQ